jgi:NAD(P)-dependent dehydrogenase (short-subunit alcohol dehydrogenase family)
LHGAGAQLAFTYHSSDAAADKLTGELPGTEALKLDVLSVSEIDKLVDRVAEKWGGVDAFIQCAGVGVTAPAMQAQVHHNMEQVDEAAWDRMQDVNTKSTFFAVRRMAGHMRSSGGGNIVLLGSIDGVKPVPAPVHYAAAKGALAAMTTAMAKELGRDGIRVNLVAPGILEGGMSRALPEDLRQEYLKHCGLRRYGRLGEIAAWVAWLALRNTYVTGQTILVDGAL